MGKTSPFLTNIAVRRGLAKQLWFNLRVYWGCIRQGMERYNAKATVREQKRLAQDTAFKIQYELDRCETDRKIARNAKAQKRKQLQWRM
jgi:hypothetical protein